MQIDYLTAKQSRMVYTYRNQSFKFILEYLLKVDLKGNFWHFLTVVDRKHSRKHKQVSLPFLKMFEVEKRLYCKGSRGSYFFQDNSGTVVRQLSPLHDDKVTITWWQLSPLHDHTITLHLSRQKRVVTTTLLPASFSDEVTFKTRPNCHGHHLPNKNVFLPIPVLSQPRPATF